jgi:uncharacterized membrane protein
MKVNIKDLVKISLILLSLDYVYLSTTLNFYKKLIKNIQGRDAVFRRNGAILCYMLLVFSIYYFIILKNGSELDAFLLGLSIYGVFDLTNYAIFDRWNYKAVVMDTLWGGILYYTTVKIHNKINI